MSCNCNTINTTPCTATTGCLSTNYARCITYSGNTLTGCVPLVAGENLDVSLGRIVDAVCALTPADMTWATYNYSCLGPFTTGQEFAEGVSLAHCNLVDRVVDVEVPVFTTCTLFQSAPYTITPGTTTLLEVLYIYGQAICSMSGTDVTTWTITDNCFTLSSGVTTLEGFIQWIVDNTCTIKTSLTALITANTNKITAIQSYLGPVSTIASKHDNTDCLGGGATDTAYDTIELLKSKVCSIDATVTGLPDLNNISLSWAPCFYSNTAASLSTQLGRMVSLLKAQNFTFDASDFTTSVGACGSTISLNGTVGFTCADLISCSLHDLGDVTVTADINTDTGGSLTYDHALGYYRPIKHTITVTATSSGSTPTSVSYPTPGLYVTETLAVNTADLSRNYDVKIVQEPWLDLSPYFGTWTDTYSVAATPHIMKTWDGQIRFRGRIISPLPYAYGATGQPLNEDTGIVIFTGIPAAYRPSVLTSVAIPVMYNNVGTDPNAYYIMGEITIDPVTGNITLFTRDQGYLMTNMSPGGTAEYLGDYSASLQGLVINY